MFRKDEKKSTQNYITKRDWLNKLLLLDAKFLFIFTCLPTELEYWDTNYTYVSSDREK